MNKQTSFEFFASLLRQRPSAMALIRGSEDYSELHGTVRFYSIPHNPYIRIYTPIRGVYVAVQLTGLPAPTAPCQSPIFGFHIHEGSRCSGNASDPFANALTHYNPDDCPHPYHAGDLPPLFGVNGSVFQTFLTNRFSVDEIIGKTIIVHDMPDDFTSQPAGNSGTKIACGVIHR